MVEDTKPPMMTSPTAPAPIGLPVARVKIIMKSSPDIDHISPQALFVMTKATEHFVQFIAAEAKKVSGSNEVVYKDLSDSVEQNDKFHFLEDVLPPKITVSEWRRRLKKRKHIGDSSSSSESSEEGSSEQEEESADDDDDIIEVKPMAAKDNDDVIVLSDNSS